MYFAPSDHHMRFSPSGIQLSRGPRGAFHSPAVDMLFVSAAVSFGKRVVGVLLSGAARKVFNKRQRRAWKKKKDGAHRRNRRNIVKGRQ